MTDHQEPWQPVQGPPADEHELPRFAKSLLLALVQEWERVWWNKHQSVWADYESGDLGALHWRPYSYNESPDPRPNFWLDSSPVQICWYKHPGRGMICSTVLTAEGWIAWHDAVMAEFDRIEDELAAL